MHTRYPSLALTALILSTLNLSGLLSVRQAVSDNGAEALPLADGFPGSGWNSSGFGQQASLLLDNPVAADAAFVLAEGPDAAPAFQLAGSMDYRNWILLAEGTADTDPLVARLRAFPLQTIQYLRLTSQTGEPAIWEAYTGPAQEVQTALSRIQPVDWGDVTDPLIIKDMMDRAFAWQMDHLATRDEGIGWVNGAFYTGVSAAYTLTGDAAYRQALVDIGNGAGWTLRERSGGKGFYHADDHAIGQAWLDLYLADPEPNPVWIAGVRQRLDRVMADPLPGRQDMNWCDALYMSPPNYVRMAEITGDNAYRTFIDGQWWDVSDFLYDEAYQLYYRDSSYFDDREPNGEPVFWSRGNGWVMGGLVRMLEHLPTDWPTYDDYAGQLREMSAALAELQGSTDGLWSSSLLYPEKYAFERETSGSAFFVYAMAWGVNAGLLDPAVYGPVIEKGWAGLTAMLTTDGVLQFIQQVGAGPALNNGQLTNKDYGYGAFLLAGTEMIRYYTLTQSSGWALAEGPRQLETGGDPGAWTPVDRFEDGLNWSESKTVPQSATLLADPFDPAGSHVYSINTGFRTAGYHRATVAMPPVAEGATATLYQRFAYTHPEIDVVFGVSGANLVDAYGDYETGLRVYFAENRMEARAGGSYQPIGEDFLQLDTWYEAWTVLDNASDTYDVYLRGGSNYPGITLLQADLPFRNGLSGSLRSFAVSYNSQFCEGSFLLDDLQLAPGRNLSRPAGVRQTPYSPWSGVPARPPGFLKETDAGSLWDGDFPWIYHVELEGWLYIWPQEAYTGGYWAWRLAPGGWLWISSAWPGWYHDGAWKQM